jgi:hypothetical protein
MTKHSVSSCARLCAALAVLTLLVSLSAHAGTMTVAPNQRFQAFDPDTGAFLTGGYLCSYLAGTTTPTPTYADYTGTVANANCLVLDGSGSGAVWLDPSIAYKLVLKKADLSVIWTLDGINTAGAGSFTTLTASGAVTFSSTLTVSGAAAFASTVSIAGQLTSTLPIGTSPFAVTSTTKNGNLNADLLDDGDWAAPGVAVGSGTRVPGTSKFTDLDVSATTTLTGALTENAACGTLATTNGATWQRCSVSELLTIAAAATTDTAANLLPADAIIEAVVVRTVVIIPTAATYTVGDPTQAARFATGVSTAAGSTAVGILHWNPTVAADTLGPRQTAAAVIRITPNAVPGAATGQVRITVFYTKFVAPTS